MPQNKGLGRGLDAFMPDGFEPEVNVVKPGAKQVAINMIIRNPRQPRKDFAETELAELAASIREFGIIQPLIVSPLEGGKYTLIAGERRWQAAKQAGLIEVPVIEREATDQELLEVALIENLQRADLNPLEEAEAYHQLSNEFGLSHETIAERVGKSRVTVTNTLRLLNLSDTVKQALIQGLHTKDDKEEHAFQFTAGHARALLGMPTLDGQNDVLAKVIEKELTVRETEAMVRNRVGEKPASLPKASPSPEVIDLEERLRASLGTKVTIRHGKKGGKLTLHYYSDEELDTLLGRLLD